MKIVPRQTILFKPLIFRKFLTRKKIHIITLLCWISLILIGTTMIGISTSLYNQTFSFCDDTDSFCSQEFTTDSEKELAFYVKVQNFHQNNRMFLDEYSALQLQGNIHSKYFCDNYYTYAQLGKSVNAGGYRVVTSSNAFPCGEAMTNIFNDSIYIVNSGGGTPDITSTSLVSEYNQLNHFKNLENYQLRQWVDMQSAKFANYFTPSYTPTKYVLLGKATLPADTYQLIAKNNYPTGGVLTKSILVTETNGFGTKDPLLGFFMFICGILTLFFHVVICCRGVK